jgi:hypothetical protein
MTKVLIHELATQAPPLFDRFHRALASNTTPEVQALLARALIDPHAKPRMVLAGQFSSGKSTLIKALTDGAVDPKVDADIATDEITEYPWHGQVILVDTPGVKSGLREHDELAWEAVGRSDFILFVVTVNLFDDAAAAFLRELAYKHQKFDQMIVVITQTSKLSAEDGARRWAVQQALGTVNAVPPICEVDSLYYLRSLTDAARADLLRTLSRIDELKDEINRISDERGDIATLRQPFQLIRQLCDDAQTLLTEDPHRRMALSVLAAQHKAVTERRVIIDTQFRTAETRLKSSCLSDIAGFVDLAMDTDQEADDTAVPAAWDKLVLRLNRHAEKFADDVNLLTAQEFDQLLLRLGEIEDSNRVTELVRYTGDVEARSLDRGPAKVADRPASRSGGFDISWAKQMGTWLKQGRALWGAGEGVKASAGSFGHQAVRQVGATFGAKFKPWQAVRIADNIGKAAKVAGFAIQAGITVASVFTTEINEARAQAARDRRRSAFITELMAMVDEIVSEARTDLKNIVDPPFNDLLAHLDQLRDEVIAADDARGTAAAELVAIAAEADRLLGLAASPKVIDVEIVGSEAAGAAT